MVIAEATRTGNDVLLQHLLKEKKRETAAARDDAKPASVHLKAQAAKSLEQAAKRREERRAEDRRAANEDEERKRATAYAQREAHEAKRACLTQVLLNRADADRRRLAAVRAKAVQRWLQTEYAAQLAKDMIAWYQERLRPIDRDRYKKEVGEMLGSGFFRRLPANVPDLWFPDDTLTMQWCQMHPPGGGRARWVRCSAPFNMVVGTYYGVPWEGRDAGAALLAIFRKCVPSPSQILASPVSLPHILHANDYNMDKAFVYGAILLSKWLGQERLPCGVYGMWPPDPPPSAIPWVDAVAVAGADAADERDEP